MNNSNITRVELPSITLPSGKTVNFRLPSKLEKRFVNHIKSSEFVEDNIIVEEFLCLLCITKINGHPVDLGNPMNFMNRFKENKGMGNGRLTPQQKLNVCNELFGMIIEFFDDDSRDWDICTSIWAGAGGINTQEDLTYIEEQVKNLLAAKADTTVKTRESSEPQGPNVTMV
jgi:hypothetical protein